MDKRLTNLASSLFLCLRDRNTGGTLADEWTETIQEKLAKGLPEFPIT